MEQRGQAAGPPQIEIPPTRLQAWARRAAELGALCTIPTQDTAAA